MTSSGHSTLGRASRTSSNADSKGGTFLRRKMGLGRRAKSLTKGHWDEVVFAQGNLDFPAYERVKLKHPGVLRPVVLFGPLADVGREMLLKDFPLRFAAPPTGTETEKEAEGSNGIIRLSAIKQVMNRKKHCVLDVTPSSVEKLQYAQYCPIVIFLGVENRKRLKEIRSRYSKAAAAKSTRKLMEQAARIEKEYPHLLTGEWALDKVENRKRLKEIRSRYSKAAAAKSTRKLMEQAARIEKEYPHLLTGEWALDKVENRKRLKEIRSRYSKAAAAKSTRKLMEQAARIEKEYPHLLTGEWALDKVENRKRLKEIRSRYSKAAAAKSTRKLMEQAARIEKEYPHLLTATLDATKEDGWFEALRDLIVHLQERRVWMSESRPGDLLEDDFLFPMAPNAANYESDIDSYHGAETEGMSSPQRQPSSGDYEMRSGAQSLYAGQAAFFPPQARQPAYANIDLPCFDSADQTTSPEKREASHSLPASPQKPNSLGDNPGEWLSPELQRDAAKAAALAQRHLSEPGYYDVKQVLAEQREDYRLRHQSPSPYGPGTPPTSTSVRPPRPPFYDHTPPQRPIRGQGYQRPFASPQVPRASRPGMTLMNPAYLPPFSNHHPPPPFPPNGQYRPPALVSRASSMPQNQLAGPAKRPPPPSPLPPGARSHPPAPLRVSAERDTPLLSSSDNPLESSSSQQSELSTTESQAREGSRTPTTNDRTPTIPDRTPTADRRSPSPPPPSNGSPTQRLPNDLRGPPTDLRGPPTDLRGPPTDLRGPHTELRAPPTDLRGPPTDLRGPPTDLRGPPTDQRSTPEFRTPDFRPADPRPPELAPKPSAFEAYKPDAASTLLMAPKVNGNTKLASPEPDPDLGHSANDSKGSFSSAEEEEEDGHTVVAHVIGVISAEGGILASEETGVSIHIPPGALPKNAQQEIYFKVCKDTRMAPPLDTERGETLLSPLVMCGPQGLEFARPVELRLPHCASGINSDHWSFALKSASGSQAEWKQVSLAEEEAEDGLQKGRLEKNFVSVMIDHF